MKISKNASLLALALTLSSSALFASNPDERVSDWMTQGWRSNASVDYVRPPRAEPAVMSEPSVRSPSQNTQLEKLSGLVDMRFSLPGTRVAILSQRREIVFERYLAGKANPRATPIGNSMSKSLVSLAVGKALCDGSIASLDDKGGKYLENLSGTSWGAATVKQLLTMSSGAFRTSPFEPTGWKNAQDGMSNRAIYSGEMRTSYIAAMRNADERVAEPGREFHYNNYDAIALTLIVESATKKKFAKYFEEAIWAEVKPESDGAWMRNNHGQVAGYMGFSARPRDWVRLGHYVLDEVKGQGCFSDYLRQATQHQVQANWANYRSYGYQIWTNCTSKAESFCFLGNHGQSLVMHPSTESVLYVHGTQNQINGPWRHIFESF